MLQEIMLAKLWTNSSGLGPNWERKDIADEFDKEYIGELQWKYFWEEHIIARQQLGTYPERQVKTNNKHENRPWGISKEV